MLQAPRQIGREELEALHRAYHSEPPAAKLDAELTAWMPPDIAIKNPPIGSSFFHGCNGDGRSVVMELIVVYVGRVQVLQSKEPASNDSTFEGEMPSVLRFVAELRFASWCSP